MKSGTRVCIGTYWFLGSTVPGNTGTGYRREIGIGYILAGKWCSTRMPTRKISFCNLAMTLISNEHKKNVPGLGTRQIVPDLCTMGYRPAFFGWHLAPDFFSLALLLPLFADLRWRFEDVHAVARSWGLRIWGFQCYDPGGMWGSQNGGQSRSLSFRALQY